MMGHVTRLGHVTSVYHVIRVGDVRSPFIPVAHPQNVATN